MTTSRFLPAAFLSSLLLTEAALAQAEVIQCINPDGSVLYTDGVCSNSDDVINVIGVPVVDVSNTHTRKMPTVVKVESNSTRRALQRDVLTIRAAYSAMLLMDQADNAARQIKIVSRN